MSINVVATSKHLAAIEAVCYWLGYQFKIGRSQLVHEASLRYPIADTFTSHSISINQIVLEKLHPLFKSKKIDLVIHNNCAVDYENVDSIAEVYEFKLAKSNTAKNEGIEHQRIFDDIIRLAYFNYWEKKDCFFLMCGTYEDFFTYFVGQTQPAVSNNSIKNIVNPRQETSQKNDWSSEGIYKDWFEFQMNKQTTKIFDDSNSTFGLSKFHSNYELRDNKRNFGRQITIRTTCMAITPFGALNRTHAAGIWKVEGVSIAAS